MREHQGPLSSAKQKPEGLAYSDVCSLIGTNVLPSHVPFSVPWFYIPAVQLLLGTSPSNSFNCPSCVMLNVPELL